MPSLRNAIEEPSTTRFFCIGVNHKTTPIALREALFLSAEVLRVALPSVKAQFAFEELFLLSTCNRLELYGVQGQQRRQEPTEIFSAYQAFQTHKAASILESAWSPHAYLLQGEAAVGHLLRVVASLDSLVVGETQITAQCKEAVALAAQVGTLGPLCQRVTQEAFHTHKQVRTQTKIGAHTVSISHAAVHLAQRIFTDIATHPILLLGAGEMIRVAAQYLVQFRPTSLRVLNRSLERAQHLVETIGWGTAFPWEELQVHLLHADIVLTSTASPEPILDVAGMKKILNQRKGRPLFIVDIAVPRDVDPACSKLSNLYLFDLDDLHRVVESGAEKRLEATQQAEAMIQFRTQQFMREWEDAALQPALGTYHRYVQHRVQREAERTLRRSVFRSLDQAQLRALQQMLHAIAAKLTADMAGLLLQTENTEQKRHLHAALLEISAEPTPEPPPHLLVAGKPDLTDLGPLPEPSSIV